MIIVQNRRKKLNKLTVFQILFIIASLILVLNPAVLVTQFAYARPIDKCEDPAILFSPSGLSGGNLKVITNNFASSDIHVIADNLTVHVNGNDPCRTEFPPSESGVTVHLFKGPYVVTESNFDSIKIGDNTKDSKHFTLIANFSSGCIGNIHLQDKVCSITNKLYNNPNDIFDRFITFYQSNSSVG